MDLYILRHGKAGQSSGGPDDAARPLTAGGRAEMRKVARWMRSEKFKFDIIATSPLTRACETAEIVAGSLGRRGRIEVWDELKPGGDFDAVCSHAARCGDDAAVLLVGHEPGLSLLTGWIITGGASASLALVKGGCAKVRDFSFEKKPAGELHWLLTSEQMIAMR